MAQGVRVKGVPDVTDQPYKPGDRVKVLYNGPDGTTLAPGFVTSVHRRANGGWEVVTGLYDGRAVSTFTTRSGHSDYLTHDTSKPAAGGSGVSR